MAGARHFTELIVWQLADKHRVEVFALTGQPAFRQDYKLRSQIDDAADSVCRNIAEGFGSESHREFARFLRIARRSLNEVQDGFRSAQIKRHLVEDDLSTARQLQRRLYPALASLIKASGRWPRGVRIIAPFAAPFAPTGAISHPSHLRVCDFSIEKCRRDDPVVEVPQIELLVRRVQVVVGQADAEEHARNPQLLLKRRHHGD